MEESFLYKIIPLPLRHALQREGTPATKVIQSVLRHVFESERGAEEATNVEMLARLVGEMLISALNPLAQGLMRNMGSNDRAIIMGWLSNPDPIVKALLGLMDALLENTNEARHLAEASLSIASSVPEVAALLQQAGGALPPPSKVRNLPRPRPRLTRPSSRPRPSPPAPPRPQVLEELQQLRDHPTDEHGPPPDPTLPARAAAVAASAAAAAASASDGKQWRSKSPRLAARRHCCPLSVLDDDCVLNCVLGLEAEPLVRLQLVSRQWRHHARRALGSDEWRRRWGCVPATSHVKVLSESRVARLDICSREFKRWKCTATGAGARLILRRLDGPSIGPVSSRHVVGIFSSDGRLRLCLLGTTEPQLVTAETSSTRVTFRPAPPPWPPLRGGQRGGGGGGGSSAAHAALGADDGGSEGGCEGLLCYEVELCLFSSCGQYMLDLGVVGGRVDADVDVWSTRLRIARVASWPTPGNSNHPGSVCK